MLNSDVVVDRNLSLVFSTSFGHRYVGQLVALVRCICGQSLWHFEVRYIIEMIHSQCWCCRIHNIVRFANSMLTQTLVKCSSLCMQQCHAVARNCWWSGIFCFRTPLDVVKGFVVRVTMYLLKDWIVLGTDITCILQVVSGCEPYWGSNLVVDVSEISFLFFLFFLWCRDCIRSSKMGWTLLPWTTRGGYRPMALKWRSFFPFVLV